MAVPARQKTSRSAGFRPSVKPTKVAEEQGTLTERVYAALKKDIVVGTLPPGESLTEQDLASRYNASRTPVREATLRLHQEDLIRIVPNRGYFVSQLTIHQINDIYEYRAAVEGECAELVASAAAAISPTALRELEKAAQFPEKTGYLDFIPVDTQFHVGIARLTRNALLLRAVTQMRTQAERIMYAAAELVDVKYYGELPSREHREILAAIRKGDPRTARQLMRDHILGQKTKVLELARSRPQFL